MNSLNNQSALCGECARLRLFMLYIMCVGVWGPRGSDSTLSVSASGLTCSCSPPLCNEPLTHCNVSDGGYCLVRVHNYTVLEQSKFEFQCVDSSLVDRISDIFLCMRSLGNCRTDYVNEVGCFCCQSDYCNTKEFFFAQQWKLKGSPSSSIPLPTSSPSGPTRSPTLGKGQTWLYV